VLQELGLKLKLNRWLFLSWLLPVAIWGLALLIAGLLPGVSYAFSVDAFLEYYRPSLGEQFSEFETQVRSFHQEYGVHPVVRMLLQALVAGVTLNAFRGLGEELGWRGLMHHELGVLGASFWHRSLVTGLAWGIWYSPLLVLGLWYRDPTFAAIPMGIAWCIAASALLGYVRDKSGSIYAPAVLYGSLEGMSKLPPLSQGGTDLLVGVHGLAGIVALTAVLFGLLAIDRRRAMRASETVG
ncbi:MAG: CPBP family intramembrane glutamic endopeptidase, partial [Myxococcota bacterium]